MSDMQTSTETNDPIKIIEAIKTMSDEEKELYKLAMRLKNGTVRAKDIMEKQKKDEDLLKPSKGGIRQRSDGRWEGRYSKNGKRISVYGLTKAECLRKLEEGIKRRDQEEKNRVVIANHTMDEWFERWMNVYKSHLKEQSLYAIRSKYEKYVQPTLGNRSMKNIHILEWQELFNDIPYPVTAKKLLTHMKACYKKAILSKVVKDNPLEGVELRNNHKPKEKFVPTKEQLDEFLEKLDEKRKDLALVCEFISLTGCRIGEALGLTLDDIHFEESTITINKSFNRDTGALTDTKTPAGHREVPLFDRTGEIIREYINTFGEKKRLFHKTGSKNFTNSVKYYAKKYGLDRLSPHGLRHYFSTMCMEAGIEQKAVQKWMGHASITMTMDTYTHVKKKHLEEQRLKLAKHLQ